MGGLIVSKTNVKVDGSIIFLAGPIRGAPNWQDLAVQFLLLRNSELFVASPRWEVGESVAKYVLPGNQEYFSRARAWERHYFDLASKTGAVMFWLPGEANHDCQTV